MEHRLSADDLLAIAENSPEPIRPWVAPDGTEYYMFDKATGRPLQAEEITARQIFIAPCCGFHSVGQPGHFEGCPFAVPI